MTEPRASNDLWGGRYAEGPSAIMREINASIGFDRKMWRQDISGSLAHAKMLAHVGIISAEDEAAIRAGLAGIAQEIEEGRFPFSEALEDIHMNIEARLTERIGEAGKRLHTGRSRNDQVALDFRLWVREACDRSAAQLEALQRRVRWVWQWGGGRWLAGQPSCPATALQPRRCCCCFTCP